MKMVEYNKIEIIKNDVFLEQKSEIELVMCCLMKQKVVNGELKEYIEKYNF